MALHVPPVANAGLDRTTPEGTNITLDGKDVLELSPGKLRATRWTGA